MVAKGRGHGRKSVATASQLKQLNNIREVQSGSCNRSVCVGGRQRALVPLDARGACFGRRGPGISAGVFHISISGGRYLSCISQASVPAELCRVAATDRVP
eukprot:COSAG02_NODE_31_length_50774_cov_1928.118204_3_plen_101_part_00